MHLCRFSPRTVEYRSFVVLLWTTECAEFLPGGPVWPIAEVVHAFGIAVGSGPDLFGVHRKSSHLLDGGEHC